MVPGLFKSRRTPADANETAKVVDAVWAYYEAGRRPAPTQLVTATEPPAAPPADEPGLISHHASHRAANVLLEEAAVTASGQSLSELADELEALIESIRYGDDSPADPV